MRRRKLVFGFLLLAVLSASAGKETPFQVMTWPPEGPPFVKLSFSKIRDLGSSSRERAYEVEVTAENLWGKKIDAASFEVYFFDKSKVRISTGYVNLSNLGIGEVVKFQMNFLAAGTPVSMKLVPGSLPPEFGPSPSPKVVNLTVNSVPQGAALVVDGHETGTTPRLVDLRVGRHELEFRKEGFNPGHFVVNIGPNDASGGSVSYELGSAVHDTLEMRDGSVITGDLQEVTNNQVRVRVAGNDQVFERNKVKRILLVERDSGQ